MSALHASIYQIEDSKDFKYPKDLWEHLATNLQKQYPDKYAFRSNTGFSVVALNESAISPCKTLTRYRRISVSIRRKRDHSTLIEISAQNLFQRQGEPLFARVDLKEYPKLQKWIREAQQVSLNDNIRMITGFISDVTACGFKVSEAPLIPFSYPAPKVETMRGERSFPVEKPSNLFKQVYSPPRYLNFTISTLFEKEQSIDGSVIQNINNTLRSLLGPTNCHQLQHSIGAMKDSLNIIVIPEDLELHENLRSREILWACESRGYLFKLTKLSSLNNRFSLKTLLCDLLHIGGASFWKPADTSIGFFAVDAGHSKTQNKSRWTKVETDSQLNIVSLKTFDTPLAEHIPDHLVNELWPSQETAVFCRDGRFSKEQRAYRERGFKENRPMLEVKKYPRSILWRSENQIKKGSIFGDAVVDPHGEITIQSCTQDINDYISPLRINIVHGEQDIIINEFLNQLCLQSLSTFSISRLHGALYYADLMSKLTEAGWPKVVGRGFRLQETIPL